MAVKRGADKSWNSSSHTESNISQGSTSVFQALGGVRVERNKKDRKEDEMT